MSTDKSAKKGNKIKTPVVAMKERKEERKSEETLAIKAFAHLFGVTHPHLRGVNDINLVSDRVWVEGVTVLRGGPDDVRRDDLIFLIFDFDLVGYSTAHQSAHSIERRKIDRKIDIARCGTATAVLAEASREKRSKNDEQNDVEVIVPPGERCAGSCRCACGSSPAPRAWFRLLLGSSTPPRKGGGGGGQPTTPDGQTSARARNQVWKD